MAAPEAADAAPEAPAAAEPSTSDWLKQRIAVELLGDAASAPWQIDDGLLFSRLQGLLANASAVVDGQPRPSVDSSGGALTASASSSTSTAAADSTRAAQELALHSLLLNMQRGVQESADAVRAFIDEADSAVIETSRS